MHRHLWTFDFYKIFFGGASLWKTFFQRLLLEHVFSLKPYSKHPTAEHVLVLAWENDRWQEFCSTEIKIYGNYLPFCDPTVHWTILDPKIRGLTFLNYIKCVYRQTYGLWNYKIFRQILKAQRKCENTIDSTTVNATDSCWSVDQVYEY